MGPGASARPAVMITLTPRPRNEVTVLARVRRYAIHQLDVPDACPTETAITLVPMT